MSSSTRRKFIQTAVKVGAACSASSLASKFAFSQMTSADSVARVFIDSRRTLAPLDRNMFGSFLEHLGRAIYEGKILLHHAITGFDTAETAPPTQPSLP